MQRGISPFGHRRIKGCSPPPRRLSQARYVLHRHLKPRHPPYTLNTPHLFQYGKKIGALLLHSKVKTAHTPHAHSREPLSQLQKIFLPRNQYWLVYCIDFALEFSMSGRTAQSQSFRIDWNDPPIASIYTPSLTKKKSRFGRLISMYHTDVRALYPHLRQ